MRQQQRQQQQQGLWVCLLCLVGFVLFHPPFLIMMVHASSSVAAGHETLIGVVGQDFVMLGADTSISQSIALQSSNVDKIHVLVDDPLVVEVVRTTTQQQQQQVIAVAAAGNAADTDRLVGMLTAQTSIRHYETSVGSDVEYINLQSSEENNIGGGDGDGGGFLTVEAVARLARYYIASSLRSQTSPPLQVYLLVAGMQVMSSDEDNDDEDGCNYESFSQRLQSQVQQASRNFQPQEEESFQPTSSDDDDEASMMITESEDSSSSSSSSSSSFLLKPRLYWLDQYGALQKLHYGAHGLGANFLLSVLDQGYNANLSRDKACQLIQECFRQLQQRYVINSPQPPLIKCIDKDGCHTLLL